MFYEPAKRDHGMRYDPFKGIVVPRPIGWISSVSAAGGINLAPYSYFNAVASDPPMVMFSSEGEKDSVRNVRETGEFCCSLVSSDLGQQMNASSAPLPRDVSEFEAAGLTPEPSRLIRPPRVREARAALECKVTSIQRLPRLDGVPSNNFMVIGQVIGVFIDDAVIRDGRVDARLLKVLSRLGYKDYAAVENVFELTRPKGGGDLEPGRS